MEEHIKHGGILPDAALLVVAAGEVQGIAAEQVTGMLAAEGLQVASHGGATLLRSRTEWAAS